MTHLKMFDDDTMRLLKEGPGRCRWWWPFHRWGPPRYVQNLPSRRRLSWTARFRKCRRCGVLEVTSV